MARDARQLRQEAADATAAGKHKRALAAYLELETLESRDAQWPKRAGETYRKLNRNNDAVDAFTRAADRYAQGGFLVQAIAVCKLILQIDPRHDAALQRIGAMNEQIGAGPTRALVMADNNPNLAENTAVAALRRGSTEGGSNAALPLLELEAEAEAEATEEPIALPRTRTPQSLTGRTPTPKAVRMAPGSGHRSQTQTPPFGSTGHRKSDREAIEELNDLALPRTRTSNAQSQMAMARTKSKPITLPPNSGIDAIDLKSEIPEAFEREENSGVYVIPIDDEDFMVETTETRPSVPQIVVEPSSAGIEVEAAELDDISELDLEDIEEIPLPAPRALGQQAAEALAATPLFSGLSQEALESLVEELQLIQLADKEILFYEGDPGDALYVIVEGEVSVLAEGPPRVEMARLGPGSFIGEVALMTDQPRSATVASVNGGAELLRIDRATLKRVLATHGEVLAAVLRFVRERLVDRWTRTSPLFRPFDSNERQALASKFKFLEIEAGRVLLGAGVKPDGLYIVLAGHFDVRRAGQQLAILGPGDLIGETALLAGTAVKSDIVARGKALALCLPAGEFREMIMTHPHVLEYIGEQAEASRKLQLL